MVPSLHLAMMDKQILNDFNDSLISCLWELLSCSSGFMDSSRDEMQILYAGLRFLKSILRQEEMDQQNGKIGAILSEAGIIIFSLLINIGKEGEVRHLEFTEVLDCCDMLANTNIHIRNVKDQVSGSSTTESLHNSSHSLRKQQQFWKPSKHKPSEFKTPILHDEVVVGLDDEADKIIKRLISGQEKLEIVPIVGMGGLGKTTLTKKVYNDSSIVYNFHIRLWSTVSQDFNMRMLLIQFLCSSGKHSKTDEEFKDLNQDDLRQKLYQKLKGNIYLVVFDDVWDIKVWNDLMISFPDEKNGSRNMRTSRFSNVASHVQYGGEPHQLRPLSEKESFELLQRKVFGEEKFPDALCGFGMEIVEKCKGLPLTIVIVAGILATVEQDILVWEEFAESLTSTMVSGIEMWKKSLELSYGHLPHHLKACLLYFAAFQEDEKINAKNLMRMWTAEGFVEKIAGKSSEDIAGEYLMHLIDRSLVMVSEIRSTNGVKTCYIHDLIFEFCKAEAKESNFLQILRGYDELSSFNEQLPSYVPPRLLICSNGEDFTKSRLLYPRLGSLFFLRGTPARKVHSFDFSFLFCAYKHLKVLKLEQVNNIRLKELPTEIESLLCLSYLALTARQMNFIPSSIAKLSNLETFYLNSDEMVSLPDSICNMEKLKHVRVRNGSAIIRLSSTHSSAKTVSTLPNLETLSYLHVSLDQEGENILRKIANIRRLKIQFSESSNTVRWNISQLECLESLAAWGRISDPPSQLSFPMSLKKLVLRSFQLFGSQMTLIEQLPNLEVLKLRSCKFAGHRWELMEGGFPKLSFLSLSRVYFRKWTEADPDSDDYFPCLQQLSLHEIPLLKTVPSCLGRISTLEKIKVWYCGRKIKNLLQEIEAEQENYGNENLQIITIDQ